MNWKEYKQGIKDGLPICFGYFAVSFTFGMLAKKEGLTGLQAVLISLTNLTSAGQFAGLSLIVNGGGLFEMAVTQFVVNMRYFLMSCSLSQKVDQKMPFFHRFFISFGITDEIFGVSACREGKVPPEFFYGLMSAAIPGWTFGTWCGVLSGTFLPENMISALGLAIYGMFLAIILPPAKKNKAVLAVVVSAMLLNYILGIVPVLSGISSGFRMILVTVAVAGIASVLCPVPVEEVDCVG
ncbi:MAG: AzlC family ABC transporter permease [Clostridiales bacterium]|nr:AzlC family ABC transporter permease [Clostridiales bacterium]